MLSIHTPLVRSLVHSLVQPSVRPFSCSFNRPTARPCLAACIHRNGWMCVPIHNNIETIRKKSIVWHKIGSSSIERKKKTLVHTHIRALMEAQQLSAVRFSLPLFHIVSSLLQTVLIRFGGYSHSAQNTIHIHIVYGKEHSPYVN